MTLFSITDIEYCDHLTNIQKKEIYKFHNKFMKIILTLFFILLFINFILY
jgi:hypothetical protein